MCSKRSVRKSGCRCRSHAYRKTEYDHSGGSRRRHDGGCYRSDGTDGTDGTDRTDRLKSERTFPMLVSPVGRFLYSKFIRISNSCRRRFDIRVWRWGYCRIDGFGKTGKRVESTVKMCLVVVLSLYPGLRQAGKTGVRTGSRIARKNGESSEYRNRQVNSLDCGGGCPFLWRLGSRCWPGLTTDRRTMSG